MSYLLEENNIKCDLRFTYILLFSLIKMMKYDFVCDKSSLLKEVHEIRHRLLELFEPLKEENDKLTPLHSDKEIEQFFNKVKELENDETRKMRSRLKDIAAIAIEVYMDKETSPYYKDDYIKTFCDKCILNTN